MPVVLIQPTVALARSSTNSTAVAVIEPLIVITPRHGVTGPPETGAAVGVPPGGAHVVPPGLGACGAAQPDCASSNVLSFRIGLGTSGLPSSRRARRAPVM